MQQLKKMWISSYPALLNAAEGDIEEGLIFVGENVDRCNEIISVKELVNKLTEETLMCLNQDT